MDKEIYSIWLSLALGVENRIYSNLLSEHTAKEIYEIEDYSEMTFLGERAVNLLSDKDLTKAMEIQAVVKSKGCGILCYDDELFPERLRIITSPPPVLYYRGNLKQFNDECLISVVGTRDMTEYGKAQSRRFARSFAEAGAIVVSGMAAGIDGEAHRGALEEKGFTVAILGTPIDKPYPKENEELYYEIAEKGLIFSEYYPGANGSRFSFPARNRIISGISSATVVIEAGERSGALITAELAVRQGKNLFVLPTLPGSPQSVGTNSLLQKGVPLASRPADVLSKFELIYPDKITVPESAFRLEEAGTVLPKSEKPKAVVTEYAEPVPKPKLNKDIGKLEPEEKLIVDLLAKAGKPLHPDTIVAETGLDAGDAMSALTVLELYGIVREEVGGEYKLR